MTSERLLYVGLDRLASELVQAVGVLKLARHGVMDSGEFAYGRRYVAQHDAQPLNPNRLPLQDAPFVLAPRRIRDGGALPLTIRDALPDSWGRKVLEVQHGPLSDIDALLLTNEDRVGAMVFSESLPIPPSLPPRSFPSLEELAAASRRVEAGLEIDPSMSALLRGGSLGGARPKSTFIHEQRRHIAKFASLGDEYDMEVIEAATMGTALACGIETARLFLQPLARGHAVVLERFDRTGPVDNEFRVHYLSASALLDAPYDSNEGSYVELAQLIRRISARPEHDLLDLYRRLVFNLAVGNSDDHVKNHGMLHQGLGFWRLAPAFDLVAQLNTHTGYQGMAIVPGRNESSLRLAREAAAHFGVNAAQAEAIIQSISDTVRTQTYLSARACGASAALAKRLKTFVEVQAERIRA